MWIISILSKVTVRVMEMMLILDAARVTKMMSISGGVTVKVMEMTTILGGVTESWR